MSLPSGWIVPDWPSPRRVRAFVTTRAGGVSEGEYASMNVGFSSGDQPERVTENRAIVRKHLPADPAWLAQVHGTAVIPLDPPRDANLPRADAAVARGAGHVAVVQTADCMPLLLCDTNGRAIAAAHAGWRGMAAGVIEKTVAAMGVAPDTLLAWMGPTIGPEVFEVGAEVREAFLQSDPQADCAFKAHKPGKYLADLYALARRRLAAAGVQDVYGGGFCTYREDARFFSYRRSPRSGRMGAFIWME